MTGPRPGDVPWRTAPTERPFPDVVADGTASVGGDDALRAADVATDATAPGRWNDPGRGARRTGPVAGRPADPLPAPRSAAEAPLTFPTLPPLVAGDDPASHAAVQRWMDDDRTAHADQPVPQPYRVLPTPPPPRPTLIDRSPARRTPADDAPDVADAHEHEDPQVRAWREEREFEAQFGPWRAGATARPTTMRRSTLVSPPVLFLAFVLIVVVYYLITT